MQTLDVFQSLWAMEIRQPGVAELTMDAALRQIAGAGFRGACLDPALAEIDEMKPLRPLFRQHGLDCMLNVFPHTPDELRPLLEFATFMDARLVNVISNVMPVRVDEAVPLVRRWLDLSAAFDVPVLFETHRDGLLNDLHFTLQLLEQVPELRLCADLSHFVLDRELPLPMRDRDREHFDTVIGRSDCFQGRIATREQIQVPIDFPQHEPWVELFRGWWLDGMRRWRARNADDARLIFLCELGPPPYAITDADGRELSDRWQEALTIRAWAEAAWRTSADN